MFPTTFRIFRIACVALAAVSLAAGESQLHLKSKRTAAACPGCQVSQPGWQRSHFLVQFDGMPRNEQIWELQRRGVRFLSYVPDYGYVVAAGNDVSFEGLGLAGAGRLALKDKLSPLLTQAQAGYVVEFHPDVDSAEARAVLGGLEILPHPDLLPGHWLVRGSLEAVARLAERDEVAYIFPASRELVAGENVIACGGGINALGPTGQSVASAGGWGGSGHYAAALGYYFSELTASKLPQGTVETQILRALNEWSKYVQVTFSPAASPYDNRTVNILFGSYNHGDAFPFDGPGGALAHTFYPYPENGEPLAGDMHFDASESWGVGTDPDVFSVALHEAGHALGLCHTDQPGAVMYPYYHRATGLSGTDIASIQELYPAAAAGAAPPSTPTPAPTPAPAPAPTPTPAPTGHDTVPPSLAILYPASTNFATSASSLSLRGTATDNVGVTQVTWTASGGRSGAASGTANWATPAIALYEGTNIITIRASDAAGNVGWRSVTVTKM